MSNLFQAAGLEAGARVPLAERLRPGVLADVVGQDHLLGASGPIGRMVARGDLSSVVLWGPPGVGKTTIARLLADAVGLEFVALSAVFSGVADLRKAFASARARREAGQGTLLFVDEIHRFNRAQQDGFLPVIEEGVVTLVGATTENPSFALNAALLSRANVLVLKRLDAAALDGLLIRAEAELGRALPVTTDGRARLIDFADGDGRYVLGLAEEVFAARTDVDDVLDANGLAELLQKRAPQYDATGEAHYNLISALHKAMRGSDVDASLYWLARMIEGGEDPRYIGRRVVRFASEDIGAAEPVALMISAEALRTYERIGSPEGELALAHAVVTCATAPKSNAVYVAWKAAQALAKSTGSAPPPAHILNAPTKMMKQLGYGKGYQYDHDSEDGFSGQSFWPDGVERSALYTPKGVGRERAIRERLQRWEQLRAERGDN